MVEEKKKIQLTRVIMKHDITFIIQLIGIAKQKKKPFSEMMATNK